MWIPLALIATGALAGALLWILAPRHAALVVLAMLVPIGGIALSRVFC